MVCIFPASILFKSIAGRYRPVSYPDGPITARYRFIKNAYWVITCSVFFVCFFFVFCFFCFFFQFLQSLLRIHNPNTGLKERMLSYAVKQNQLQLAYHINGKI